MAKKTSRKTLVRNLDKYLSLYIRQRDKYCVVCGTPNDLTNGHLFSRVAYSTRWDFEVGGNCAAQCRSCNLKHEYDPYPYTEWYRNKFGQDKYDQLHRRYKTVRKFTNADLQDLILTIKELLNG